MFVCTPASACFGSVCAHVDTHVVCDAAKWEQPEGLRGMPLVPDYLDGGHDLAQLPRFQRLRAAAAGVLALSTDSKLPNQRRCGAPPRCLHTP